MGQALILPTGAQFWAQIMLHGSSERAHLFRGRVALKDTICGLQAPKLLQIVPGPEDAYSACLMSFISTPPLSQTPELYEKMTLQEDFWAHLKNQLQILKTVASPYISCRQELMTRRIHERYGAHLPTQIQLWGTIHGDLHWGNLTQEYTLLDWEGWGQGPTCLDPAFLYGYALLVPSVCATLEQIFPHLFETQEGLQDGPICLLFVCCELLRMIEIHQDHPALKEPLEILAARAMRLLENR